MWFLCIKKMHLFSCEDKLFCLIIVKLTDEFFWSAKHPLGGLKVSYIKVPSLLQLQNMNFY